MSKVEHNSKDKYIKVPCNCHPETCGCGGYKQILNPDYVELKSKKLYYGKPIGS